MAIQDVHKLRAYNMALERELGERRLASLVEERKPRRVLDGIWGPDNEVIEMCLSKADWNFATRSQRLVYDPGIEPEFGFRNAFAKPEDMIRLSALSSDEYFQNPLTSRQFQDESGFWVSDLSEIYIRYVSRDGSYGFDSSRWEEPFFRYIGGYLAYEACESLTNSTQKMAAIMRRMDDQLKHAKSRDAMDEGVKMLPAGSWVSSRGSMWRDRGHR